MPTTNARFPDKSPMLVAILNRFPPNPAASHPLPQGFICLEGRSLDYHDLGLDGTLPGERQAFRSTSREAVNRKAANRKAVNREATNREASMEAVTKDLAETLADASADNDA